VGDSVAREPLASLDVLLDCGIGVGPNGSLPEAPQPFAMVSKSLTILRVGWLRERKTRAELHISVEGR